jgi:hypothetical protein
VLYKAALGGVPLQDFLILAYSITEPLLYIHSSIIWGIEKGAVSGHSDSEPQSHSIGTANEKE